MDNKRNYTNNGRKKNVEKFQIKNWKTENRNLNNELKLGTENRK